MQHEPGMEASEGGVPQSFEVSGPVRVAPGSPLPRPFPGSRPSGSSGSLPGHSGATAPASVPSSMNQVRVRPW